MHFISIKELASTNVETLSSDTILSSAMEYMLHRDHRNVIVTHQNEYRALSVYDILANYKNNKNNNLQLSQLELKTLPTIDKNSNILEALSSSVSSVEHFIATNSDGSLYGLVAYSDIISSIDPDTLMDNYKIMDFVKVQEYDDWVTRDKSTIDVFRQLEENSNNAIVVIEDKKPIGILTTRDVLRLLQKGCDLSKTVDTYMVTPISTLNYRCTINQAVTYIKDKHFKQIVTVDENGNFFAAITQKNLISATYSRWIVMMKEYHKELNDINLLLRDKSKEYEKLASTDPLTGLYNRMKFIELYVSEYKVMLQRDNSMLLVMVDLDHFKSINDTLGHNIGDRVLIRVAEVFMQELRSNDIVCRWGGEEFIILMPSTNIDDGYKVSNKIRETIANIEDLELPPITASFGITRIIDDDTIEKSTNRADSAMYQAKKIGRNCVVIVEG